MPRLPERTLQRIIDDRYFHDRCRPDRASTASVGERHAAGLFEGLLRLDTITGNQLFRGSKQLVDRRVQSATLREIRLPSAPATEALREGHDDVVACDGDVRRAGGNDEAWRRCRE